MEEGERDEAEMVEYLRDLLSQYGATTAFFVSERSGRYYHPDGVLKIVSAGDPGDRWYYRLRSSAVPFEVNIDRDTADPSRVTAFSNFRVADRAGRLIGAIGLGIDVRELSRELGAYQQRHGARVLLVARDGRVLLTSDGPPVHRRQKACRRCRAWRPMPPGCCGSPGPPCSSARARASCS